MFFFLLEKAGLYRRHHRHEGDKHDHHHGFDRAQAGRGGWSVILGDSIHNSATASSSPPPSSPTRGWESSRPTIIAHEIRRRSATASSSSTPALRADAAPVDALSGLAAVAGGIIGCIVVGPWQSYFPYLLVIASSSSIYVAVADLIPQLQHRLTLRETAAQLFWLGAGLAIVLLAISQLR